MLTPVKLTGGNSTPIGTKKTKIEKNIKTIINKINQSWNSEIEKRFIQSLSIFALQTTPIPQPQLKTTSSVFFVDTPEDNVLGKKLFAKFYFNIPNQPQPFFALVDSGSDITLIHHDLLESSFVEATLRRTQTR